MVLFEASATLNQTQRETLILEADFLSIKTTLNGREVKVIFFYLSIFKPSEEDFIIVCAVLKWVLVLIHMWDMGEHY